MTAAISDDCTAYYEYDLNSIRDKKTVNAVTYNFITQNGKVVRQTWTEGETSHVMDFIYDNTGSPYICVFDGKLYEYVLNLQGDVIAMIDLQNFGTTVATYTYDAWGNILASSGDMAAVNPLRYRGYYYDSETGFYYLQSRYYDPVVRRFINSDSFASTGQGFLGYNMFAYCNNNPVMYSDPTGAFSWLGALIGGVTSAIGAITGGASLCEVVVQTALGALGGGCTSIIGSAAVFVVQYIIDAYSTVSEGSLSAYAAFFFSNLGPYLIEELIGKYCGFEINEVIENLLSLAIGADFTIGMAAVDLLIAGTDQDSSSSNASSDIEERMPNNSEAMIDADSSSSDKRRLPGNPRCSRPATANYLL